MYNVIIVDDEELVLEGMKTCIPWDEFQMEVVETFNYAEEALRYLSQNKVDLIITDIKMPVMDGIEFLKIVYENFPEIKTVILSGYNEFEYAQKAILYGASGYIIKPTEEASVNIVLNKLKNEMINTKNSDVYKLENVVRNIIIYNESNIENYKEVKDFLVYGNFYLMVIKEVSGSVSPLVIYNMINEIKISSLKVKHFHIAFKHSDSVIILFALEEYNDEILFREMACFLQGKMRESRSLGSIFASIEGPAHDLGELNNLYRLAEEKLKYTFHFDGCLSNIKLPEKNKIINSDYLEDYLNIDEFISSVILADKDEKVSDIVDEFIANIKNIYLEDSIIKSIPDKIVDRILALIIDNPSKEDISDLLSRNIVSSFNELKSFLVEIIVSLKMKYLDNYHSHEKAIVNTIKKYVEKHYSENISLDKVAQHVNISIYYLCHIFKEITGMTFLQYLINYRMEKAKMLIYSSDSHIYRIAEMVGYSDSRHFVKHFKRIFGMTPSKMKTKRV